MAEGNHSYAPAVFPTESMDNAVRGGARLADDDDEAEKGHPSKMLSLDVQRFTKATTQAVPSAQAESAAHQAIRGVSNESKHMSRAGVLPRMVTNQNVSEPLPQPQLVARWPSARIAIKANGKILLLDAAEVIAIEAKGINVLLRRTSSSHLLRVSLATIEEKLRPHGFVRIHRSVLVNAARVQEIKPTRAGEYVICLNGVVEYRVTRTYKKNLQALAQSWIGIDNFVVD